MFLSSKKSRLGYIRNFIELVFLPDLRNLLKKYTCKNTKIPFLQVLFLFNYHKLPIKTLGSGPNQWNCSGNWKQTFLFIWHKAKCVICSSMTSPRCTSELEAEMTFTYLRIKLHEKYWMLCMWSFMTIIIITRSSPYPP